MLVETDAIVISTLKYDDSSLIVSCYCKKLGLKSFIVKGILKSKKGLIRRSFFQPLNILSIITNYQKNKSQKLHFFKEIKIVEPFQKIHLDIKKNNTALFISEILRKTLPEDGGVNIKLFDFLRKSILDLERKIISSAFYLKFLIELSGFLGFYPNMENINNSFFDLEAGCFSGIENHENSIKGESLEEFKKILNTPFDKVNSVSISSNLSKEILENLMQYFRIHLQSFNNLKSYKILNDLF
ncbi:MAG: DNA repair protein RecO [Flavobacteriaceae bacterium]|mgnify:FL=1|nr:DNA repair protein RecO [Flavobacteriaceae bacterium]|tara:strand:- start:23859 stop:24584 length:726 start_codon:yes stop_codon:yes gene_type:complete